MSFIPLDATIRLATIFHVLCEKIKKNCTVDEIADMLEETPERIQQIRDTALLFAPDYDEEQIYAELVKKKVF